MSGILRGLGRYAVVFAALLFLQVLPAATGVAQGSRPELQEEKDYSQKVQELYQLFEGTPKDPKATVRSDLLAVAKALFEPSAVEITYRAFENSDAGKKALHGGTILFSKGRIFIRTKAGQLATDDEWLLDYATLEGKLYEWSPAKGTGRLLNREPGDTVDFLLYLVDPAGFKRGILFQYLDKREAFTVSEAHGVKTVMFREPAIEVQSLQILEHPLWLYSVAIKRSLKADAPVVVWEVDRPKPIERIPPDVTKVPGDIPFAPATTTIKWRMSYL